MMLEQKKILIAYGLGIFACLLWSGNFVIARGAQGEIPPITLAFLRWMVALLCILPLALPHFRKNLPLLKAAWLPIISMGIVAVGAFNTLLYIAGHHTDAHHIALIASTSPVWTMFLAAAIGQEKITLDKTSGMILAVIGALVVMLQGDIFTIFSLSFNRGDTLVLIAAFLWAIYCVLLKYRPKELHGAVFLCALIIIGLLCLLPFFIWETLALKTLPPHAPHHLAIYAYIGIAASVLAWFAWNKAVVLAGAVKAGIVYYTTPLFTSLLAVFLLKEPLHLYHLTGFMFVLCGVLISNRKML